jgi:hypothetical protein
LPAGQAVPRIGRSDRELRSSPFHLGRLAPMPRTGHWALGTGHWIDWRLQCRYLTNWVQTARLQSYLIVVTFKVTLGLESHQLLCAWRQRIDRKIPDTRGLHSEPASALHYRVIGQSLQSTQLLYGSLAIGDCFWHHGVAITAPSSAHPSTRLSALLLLMPPWTMKLAMVEQQLTVRVLAVGKRACHVMVTIVVTILAALSSKIGSRDVALQAAAKHGDMSNWIQ